MRRNRTRRTDSGVIIPLAAIMIGVVLFILVALGIDAVFTRLARASAQQAVEEMCGQGAEYLPRLRRVVGTIVNLFNNFQTPPPAGKGGVRFADITSFRILAPTAPNNGALRSSTINFTVWSSVPTDAPITAMGLSCTLPNGGSCEFGGNVAVPGVLENYPENFWNPHRVPDVPRTDPANNDSYGDVISCELTARVRTLLQRNISIQVKTAYETRVRGALYPPSGVTVPASSARPQRGGGIILGISTHLTTRLNQSRFQFDVGSPFYNSVLRQYDPLRTAPPVRGFRGYKGTLPAPYQRLPLRPFPDGQLRQERLISCMNPLVLARNAILVGLTGRFVRGGERDRLEVVHMGTRSLAAPSPEIGPPLLSGVGGVNRPTLLWRGWTDAGNSGVPGGHLPYIQFQSSAGTLLDPNEPTSELTNTDATGRRYDSAMVGVLRDCEHLYEGAPPLSPHGINRYVDSELDNAPFDPSAIASFSSLQSFAQTTTTFSNLETNGTWSRGANQPFQNVEQMVSALGTVQSCPWGEVSAATIAPPWDTSYAGRMNCANLPGGQNGKPAVVMSPTLPPEDLRPDIEGFVGYLRDAYLTAPAFPPLALLGVNPATNWSFLASSTSRFSESAAILVFLHKRITLAEANRIGPVVDNLPAGVNITVVYMPSNQYDADARALQTLRTAFRAVPPVGASGQQNVLFVIAPSDCPIGGCGAPESAWDGHFRSYWMALFDPGNPNNIQTITQVIFNRLKYVQVKL